MTDPIRVTQRVRGAHVLALKDQLEKRATPVPDGQTVIHLTRIKANQNQPMYHRAWRALVEAIWSRTIRLYKTNEANARFGSFGVPEIDAESLGAVFD